MKNVTFLLISFFAFLTLQVSAQDQSNSQEVNQARKNIHNHPAGVATSLEDVARVNSSKIHLHPAVSKVVNGSDNDVVEISKSENRKSIHSHPATIINSLDQSISETVLTKN